MLNLTSSTNSDKYIVYVRGIDKPLIISNSNGKALSDYLVGQDVSMFVSIKDVKGKSYTIRTTTIDRVEVQELLNTRYKTPLEMGMPELGT